MHVLLVSGSVCAISWTYAGGEVSMFPIQRVGLTPDVPVYFVIPLF